MVGLLFLLPNMLRKERFFFFFFFPSSFDASYDLVNNDFPYCDSGFCPC